MNEQLDRLFFRSHKRDDDNKSIVYGEGEVLIEVSMRAEYFPKRLDIMAALFQTMIKESASRSIDLTKCRFSFSSQVKR